MTRKDYVLLAQAIQNARMGDVPKLHQASVNTVVDELCRVLKQDNPRFDSDRFKEQCMVSGCKCSKFTWDKFTKKFVNFMGNIP